MPDTGGQRPGTFLRLGVRVILGCLLWRGLILTLLYLALLAQLAALRTSAQEPLQLAVFLSAAAKEGPDEFAGLRGEQAGLQLGLVILGKPAVELDQRAQGSSLGICCGVDHALDTCLLDC